MLPSRPGQPSQPAPSGKHPSVPAADPLEDPDVYASILSALLAEKNPLRLLTGDLARMLDELLHIGRKRQHAEQHLARLQHQLDRMESGFARVNPKTIGQRLNKVR